MSEEIASLLVGLAVIVGIGGVCMAFLLLAFYLMERKDS